METVLYQIGEVAARVDLSLSTIRHYEDAGIVIPSTRSNGGFRLYTEAEIGRLLQVKAMKPLGFSLDETRDIMTLQDRITAGEPLPDHDAARLADYSLRAKTKLAKREDELVVARGLVSALGDAVSSLAALEAPVAG